ncbi:RNA-binding protein, putative [Plasmodium knowlesi strain H]|uniref:RNA-binding protein, putative n=3 Tax=Plasmodium knowlesi TaxID=5850 RepID=A0A5K1VPT2_PLAKH|nr:RNA-binding protein, putative [Plasmodium knowlesi strain H]OTN64395.1 putative RNA binding protein [Plasmodium knowlesi]CAA9989281.1 RNA-binding protein, putative [Plasmodium knowlesi strain H]SBO26143.1 RNA-binding protein, putative [Plasmodium knowlesi strain H]SBO26846.1 RNA-binding protein, putative [Plasmodium knowlesi strain H]VVS78755.1 RNA-binding protein, putative [Plasmodium knowlesi strain H]|eukprot:XP_002261627.1 RNA binding protein, putative [Plasmodium knowlesi strain H]
MITQKRSYSHINNEGEMSNHSDEEGAPKRPRNKSASSNRSFGSYNDEENENDERMSYTGSGTTTEMRIPYCLLLPNRAIGFVIGKSGSNVREIEKACGAVIKCQKEFDISVYPPPSEKILTIFGKKENKKKALELVLGKSKTVMDFHEEDGKESIVIIVPTRSIPIIIGQKGSKIAALCEKSECEINVHNDDVPGIKDKAIFIKSKKIGKIIDCIGIIYDLLEDIVDNGILSLFEFPGVPKSGTVISPLGNGGGGGALPDAPDRMGSGPMNNNMPNNQVNGGGGGPNSHFHQGGAHHHFNHDAKYNMKINDNSNSFEYMSGDDYDNFSVPNDRNLLFHRYGKEVSACVIRFVLDVETTAWIIGKAGCHIKEIRTITGAGAVIVDAPDNIENVKTCDRILTLSGSAENKYNALKLIVRQMEEREKNINHPMRMLVPGKAASFLIGKKGSIIKYITDMSGSQIQVAKNKESENEKLVLISGSPDSKILASILVLQKLEEYENPAIVREGLLIPLNEVLFSSNNNKYANVKKGNNNNNNNNNSYNKSGVGNQGKPMHNHHQTNMNSDRHFSPNSMPNNHYGRASSPHGVNGSGYGGGTKHPDHHRPNHHYPDSHDDGSHSPVNNNYPHEENTMHIHKSNHQNSHKNTNDMKDKVEKLFLQQLYKSFPISSLPKILSITQPYTIELNMPDVYLETFDSQNKNGKSLIEEIIEKSGCNISICTDSNDSSSYTFILSITGSPLANSIAILMIQAKIFQFDWF